MIHLLPNVPLVLLCLLLIFTVEIHIIVSMIVLKASLAQVDWLLLLSTAARANQISPSGPFSLLIFGKAE